MLTYASHASIGGLRGAIASRAEATVTFCRQGAGRDSARPIRADLGHAEFGTRCGCAGGADRPVSPAKCAARIVVAMIDARLLIASSEGTITTVRPAHDALLTHGSARGECWRTRPRS